VDSLATWSRQLALSFGCADKGLSGAGRHSFYLALLIACRAFAQVCSIIHSGKRTAASFRWIPPPQRPRDADNLAFAGPSEATVVEQKMGLDDKELAFESSSGSVREWRQRELPGHGRTARRSPRGSGIPSLPPPDLGSPATMVRDKILEGYGWPDDHHVAAGRSSIFDPVEAKDTPHNNCYNFAGCRGLIA
jgi:hypothetical protein